MNFKFKVILLLLPFFLFFGCKSYNDKTPSVSGHINDQDSWYNIEKDSVTVMNVTFNDPNEYLCSPYYNVLAPQRGCTLDDINHDINPDDNYEPKLHVNMQALNFNTGSNYNASLKIKGGYSRTNIQKSYSIKLDSNENLYLEQRKFPLTKSQSDPSRLKNKVAFALLRQIPNITGLPVNFFHLYMNGVDYGLFNQPESIREEYLIRRGWNKDDHIYNAVNFFFKYDDWSMAIDDKGEPKNPELFEEVIEIKNGKDHSKLIEMLHAIEDTDNIDDVVEKYFDRDNLLTWFAFNLVLSNKDTIQHNYYLYNPLFSNKFYFLPWDLDGSWESPQYLGKNEYGIGTWWELPLFRKFVSIKKNRDDLYAMADKIRNTYITDQNVRSLVNKYLPLVLPFQSTPPDSNYNSYDGCIAYSNKLVTRLQENVALYKSTIGDPMPFGQHVEYTDNKLKLMWDKSVDFENDPLAYNLEVTTIDDPNFMHPFIKEMAITDNDPRIKVDTKGNFSLTQEFLLKPGKYLMKVTSYEINNPSHYQISFDRYDNGGIAYFGVLEFSIE